MSEFKEPKHEPYETSTETCFTSETTPHVSEIRCTHRYRIDYKDHNRKNVILKITKFDEENKVLFLKSLTGATGPAAFDDNENGNRYIHQITSAYEEKSEVSYLC